MIAKVLDLLYITSVVGLLVGGAATGLLWLRTQVGLTTAVIPVWSASASAIGAIVLLCLLLEKLLPLRAVSQQRWVYQQRPRGKVSSVDAFAEGQLVATSLLGAVLGITSGYWWVFAIGALALRAIVGVVLGSRRKTRLPSLLEAGRSRELATVTFNLMDSELAADIFASRWGKWRSDTVTVNQWVIALRRIRRRSYVLLAAIIVLLGTLALVNALGNTVVVVFGLAWTFVVAGLFRATDLSRIGLDSYLPYAVAIVVAFIGALFAHMVLLNITVAANPWVVAVKLLTVTVALAVGGVRRGKPRRVDDYTVIDTGMGVTIQPGFVGYVTKGLSWPLTGVVATLLV